MARGVKHNIQCLCVLPQYRKTKDPPYHEFVVFSVIDDSDTVEEKYAQCNNCGAIHKIIDLCRSEIATDRAELVILTKEDIKLMKETQLMKVLKESY